MTDSSGNIHIKKKVKLRSKTAEAPLEENGKPKVSLKRKMPEAAPAPSETAPTSPEVIDDGKEPKGKLKWYAAALAGLLVLGGGGYYLSQQGNKDSSLVAEVVDSAKPEGTTASDVSETKQDEQSGEESNPEEETGTSSEVMPSDDAPAASKQKVSDNTPTVGGEKTQSIPEKPVNDKPVAKTKDVETKANGVTSATGSVEQEAIEVIRGKYGNGIERKRNLGDRYAEIQSKVNEMYRKGLVR